MFRLLVLMFNRQMLSYWAIPFLGIWDMKSVEYLQKYGIIACFLQVYMNFLT